MIKDKNSYGFYNHNANKFTTEKRLHEVIRDLPEVKKIDDLLERGLITLEDALYAMYEEIRKEKERSLL